MKKMIYNLQKQIQSNITKKRIRIHWQTIANVLQIKISHFKNPIQLKQFNTTTTIGMDLQNV